MFDFGTEKGSLILIKPKCSGSIKNRTLGASNLQHES
jgi:hypothetical protein